jgi:predicted nucleotidyltransferase component of viral defense system
MSPAGNVTRDTWKEMLACAVAIFEDLEGRDFGIPDVVLGGGTVLIFRFEHRLSKDIDLFLHDAQWLPVLTPRLNDTTAAMATSYQERGNSLKLVMPRGDIHFIVSGPVTEAAAADSIVFMGRTFLLEATEEILAKKLLYRAAQFQPRDIFDFAVAIEEDRASAARALTAAAANRDLLVRRIEQLSRLSLDRLTEGILPIGDFSRIMPAMIDIASRFIASPEVAP